MQAFLGTFIDRTTDRPYRLLAGLFFLGLALVYYLPSLSWLPRGIHEWAQADRLALAFGFYDHGLDFFHPRTLNVSSTDGVVGVEFPLVPYLAAVLAKVFGRAALVPLFRLLTSATAWLACYYLFRLVFERTRQFAAALLPGVFLLASPLFAYYAGNFIPDPVGAACAVVAAYYLLRYPVSRRFADLVVAIALFTLATLLKLSAGIYLVAALATLLLWAYLQPTLLSLRQRVGLLLLAAGSVLVLGAYTLHTYHLNAAYHAWIFLTSPKPLDSWEKYDYVMTRVKQVWMVEYLTTFQYVLLAASVLICLLGGRRIVRTEGLWAAQLGLALVGFLAFGRLMGAQFADHDYYLVAPLGPGVLLLVALAATELAQCLQRLSATPRWLPATLFGALLLGLLVPGLRQYRARMGDPYRGFSSYYQYRWLQGGAAQLAAARVPAQATILVLGTAAPNLGLVYFDRRGLTWEEDAPNLGVGAIVQRMQADGLDYLVMRRQSLQAQLTQHPDMLTEFSVLTTTPEFAVLKLLRQQPHW